MKTDRELLELAAKAAGYAVDCAFDDGPLIYGLEAGPDGPREWNPLEGDGDAFRLAVVLGLEVNICSSFCKTICWHGRRDACIEFHGNSNQYMATRRAIVRAAAAIGEAMP